MRNWQLGNEFMNLVNVTELQQHFSAYLKLSTVRRYW